MKEIMMGVLLAAAGFIIVGGLGYTGFKVGKYFGRPSAEDMAKAAAEENKKYRKKYNEEIIKK